MALTRRQLIVLAAAAATTGCKREDGRTASSSSTPPSTASTPSGPAFDAGPIGAFKEDDVYTEHRDDGFFVVRRDQQLFALSSVCTHKGCKVRVADDLSFFCKCHKSTFDKDGRVTKGPAKRDLPRIPVATDEQGHVHVALGTVPRPDSTNDGPPI
jgi:Rieske Fe-S protein